VVVGVCAAVGAEPDDAERVGEHARPREHRSARDRLEQGEVDRGGDEERDREGEPHQGDTGADRHPRAESAQHDRSAHEQDQEAEHHHGRHPVVEVLVGVQGHAPHQGEADADHVQADAREGGGPAADGSSTEAADIPSDEEGEHDDHESADLERRIEQCTREITEDSELAEMQLPPQWVARGGHGKQ
jgi:hypothetical protein